MLGFALPTDVDQDGRTSAKGPGSRARVAGVGFALSSPQSVWILWAIELPPGALGPRSAFGAMSLGGPCGVPSAAIQTALQGVRGSLLFVQGSRGRSSRESNYESGGQEFESLRARHLINCKDYIICAPAETPQTKNLV